LKVSEENESGACHGKTQGIVARVF